MEKEKKTDETYSLSFLVVRSSGSLPRRPTRVSFERSYDRAAVDENACCSTAEDDELNVERENVHVAVRVGILRVST